MNENEMIKENTEITEQKEVKPKSYKKIRLIAVIAATVLTSAAAVCGGLWAYFNPDINPSILGEPKITLSVNDGYRDDWHFFSSPDVCWVDWGDGKLDCCDKDEVFYQGETYLAFSGKIKGDNIRIYSREDITFFQCFEEPLTLIDISNCPALESLRLEGIMLKEIDLSHNPRLISLYLSQSGISELDVTHNPELKELDCSWSDLHSLDVSHNTKLEWLSCEKNRLTQLDLSDNTALTYLDCGHNDLTKLDISHNEALTTLYCSQNYTLDSLDLSGNAQLVNLFVTQTGLS